MDKLRAEIAKKKSAVEAVRSSATGETESISTATAVKFIRQRDREEYERQQLEALHKKLHEDARRAEESKATHQDSKRRRTDTTLVNDNGDEPADPSPSTNDRAKSSSDRGKDDVIYEKYAAHFKDLSTADVKSRLRDIQQPATLFGETDAVSAALMRL